MTSCRHQRESALVMLLKFSPQTRTALNYCLWGCLKAPSSCLVLSLPKMTVGEPARAQDRHAALASSMDNDPKPLSVIVIGAGIAGLTAAAALRKAGHIVQMSTRHVVKVRTRVTDKPSTSSSSQVSQTSWEQPYMRTSYESG